MAAVGALRKMRVEWQPGKPVRYFLPVGDLSLSLNDSLGKPIRLRFDGEISCLHCGGRTPKSYSQGFCFKHARSLAACDLCIVRPETCHHHLGTCREPEWGLENCMIPHTVYVANSSGLKVGITRSGQRLTRWIDQGAVRARAVLEVNKRRDAGLVEAALAKHVSDKTNWRAMLKGEVPVVDLQAAARELLAHVPEQVETMPVEEAGDVEIEYPILEYPDKITSLNFDKAALVEGTLLGIKGQYLILDTGVINIRKFAGYHVSVEGLEAGEAAGALEPAGLFDWPDPSTLERVGPYGHW